jgi:hypothetical protein
MDDHTSEAEEDPEAQEDVGQEAQDVTAVLIEETENSSDQSWTKTR